MGFPVKVEVFAVPEVLLDPESAAELAVPEVLHHALPELAEPAQVVLGLVLTILYH